MKRLTITNSQFLSVLSRNGYKPVEGTDNALWLLQVEVGRDSRHIQLIEGAVGYYFNNRCIDGFETSNMTWKQIARRLKHDRALVNIDLLGARINRAIDTAPEVEIVSSNRLPPFLFGRTIPFYPTVTPPSFPSHLKAA